MLTSESYLSSPHFPANLPLILDKLCMFDLEENIDEVIYNIYHEEYKINCYNRGIAGWTVHEVIRWMRRLKFFGEAIEDVCNTLLKECIDGRCLMVISETDWVRTLHLNFKHFIILRIIIQGWKMGPSEWVYSPNLLKTPIGVSCGVVADLSGCSADTVQLLSAVDNACGDFGVGGIYGQLVTVGYKEYQSQKTEMTPIGSANDTFVLQRRKVPNGTKIKSINYLVETEDSPSVSEFAHSSKRINFSIPSLSAHRFRPVPIFDEITRKTVVLEYQLDPTRDVFQIGRAVNGGNDFIVPGVLHVDDEGCTTGPISRWACRIECERLPPFRSFIYAGGFDPVHQVISPSRVHIPHDQQMEDLDGFLTFGVKILQPEEGEWLEVSVRGSVFHTRGLQSDSPVLQVETDWGNQLTDGTLIDLGGVLLLYQSPIKMAVVPMVDPHCVVEHLNALKPHCPVLFNSIAFTYQDAQERIFQARTKAYEAGALTEHASGIHVPVADYSHLSEENRPYVFPACGHIFAYHKSIEGRPCPLCRQEGPFVPLAFTFEPALSDAMPTHVFNPCGHVAAQDTCERWARLWVHSRDPGRQELVHVCPYCAVELHDSGPHFSRLCLQTESGMMWPSSNIPRTKEAIQLEETIDERLQRTPASIIAEKYAFGTDNQALVATIRSQQKLFARERLSGEHPSHRKTRSFPKHIPQKSV